MKIKGPVAFVVSMLIASCDQAERDLGDKFVLYQQEASYPQSIGLDVGGGIQGLFDGDIVAFGYDDYYITFKTRKGDFFYIEKSKILKDPAEPSNREQGPFSMEQFANLSESKGLPPLSNKP